MLHIAIVEDDPQATSHLQEHLSTFEAKEGVASRVTCFSDGVEFLTNYTPCYDLILMDVDMPFMKGTDAARRLREKDAVVPLVFITNMAQYAIRGYEVNALDYVLKPVTYYRFSALLKKIVRHIRENQGRQVVIRTPGGMQQVPDSRIAWVEVEDHLLLYHTDNGVIESWGTLKSAEELLPAEHFIRVSKSAIVSFRHITAVAGDSIWIGSKEILISRRQKKTFLDALNQYMGR